MIDMTKSELIYIRTELMSLSVFRGITKDTVVSALNSYFGSLESDDTVSSVSEYAEFVSRLYDANGGDLTAHIEELCYDSENIYVRTIGEKKEPKSWITDCVREELSVLGRVASLTRDELTEPLRWSGFLPDFHSESIDLAKKYFYRVENIGKYGYGKYAHNRMFYIDELGEIIPVKNPDKISLDELVDYEIQRNQIIENTKALLSGKPQASEEHIDHCVGLFLDLDEKAVNGEISTHPVDLRGMIAALRLMTDGMRPKDAIAIGITNKCFDEYEYQLVQDVVMTRFV